MNNSNDNDPITIVEFCAGYGGLGLGIEKALNGRMRLIGLCELEGFAQANLISKMEAGLMAQVPIWSNLLTFPYRKFRGLVDIAVAGIPCQPHSNAGKRKGGADERFLFDDWLRGLEDMQPRAIFIENVEGLLTSKMPDGTLCIAWTIERLEAMGYRVEAGIFSASEVGAPHQRKRVFILAHCIDAGSQGWLRKWQDTQWQGVDGHAGCCGAGVSGDGDSWPSRPRELADDTSERLPLSDGQRNEPAGQRDAEFECRSHIAWPSRPGEPQHGWEPPRVVGRKLDHPAVGRCDGIDASSSRYVGPGTEAENLGSEATHSSCCDGKAAGTMANDHRPHAGHGEQRPERTLGDLSGGCGEAMDDAARLRSAEPADGRGQASSWSNASGDEAMGDTSDWSSGQQPPEQQGRDTAGRSSDESGAMADNLRRRLPHTTDEQWNRGTDDHAFLGTRIAESGGRQAQPPLGECFDEPSSILGQTLTLKPYGDNVYQHENLSKKRRAREILFEVWDRASSEAIQWTTRGLQHFLAEKILQSRMQLDGFTQRICYFVWCIQTGHQTQGWGLHGMQVYESSRSASQGQKPIEQFKRELGYAMCQLSYEIALERGQDPVETKGILQGVRESSARAWALSEALPEMEEVWQSTLDQTVWEKGCYVEASSVGNRTDELRLLGNGVVPATAERAFKELSKKFLLP